MLTDMSIRTPTRAKLHFYMTKTKVTINPYKRPDAAVHYYEILSLLKNQAVPKK